MKASKKTLLSVLGCLVVVILIILTIGRTALSNIDTDSEQRGQQYTVSPDLTNFNKIDVSGSWDIEIVQGDEWAVTLISYDIDESNVLAYVDNEELVLKQKSSLRIWQSSSENKVEIQMPILTELDFAGASEVEISGFFGEKLIVDVAGAAELTAKDGRYTDLIIDGAGAVEIDFKDMLVTNADIDMAGASEVILSMDGGELIGSIAGAGSVEYYGTVSKQDVDIAGAGSIDHRD